MRLVHHCSMLQIHERYPVIIRELRVCIGIHLVFLQLRHHPCSRVVTTRLRPKLSERRRNRYCEIFSGDFTNTEQYVGTSRLILAPQLDTASAT
jgi:hypothetical protein